MRADLTPLVARDLLGLTVGGVQSLQYRGGVFRLLGVPTPTVARFSMLPPLPSVGFQYERTRSEAFHRSPFHAVPSDADVPTPRGGSRQAAATDRRSPAAGPAHASTRRDARPGSESDGAPPPVSRSFSGDAWSDPVAAVVPEAPERHIDPDPDRAAGGISIPGVTERQSVFAAIARMSRSEGAKPPVPGDRQDERVRGRLPSPDVRTSPAQSDADVVQRASPSVDRAERPREPSTAVSMLAPQREVSRRDVPPANTSAVSPRVLEGIARLRSAMSTMAVRQALGSSEGPPTDSDLPAPPISTGAVLPPVAPAPVVLVWRPTVPNRRIPRAFWHSSTLRSVHLGALR